MKVASLHTKSKVWGFVHHHNYGSHVHGHADAYPLIHACTCTCTLSMYIVNVITSKAKGTTCTKLDSLELISTCNKGTSFSGTWSTHTSFFYCLMWSTILENEPIFVLHYNVHMYIYTLYIHVHVLALKAEHPRCCSHVVLCGVACFVPVSFWYVMVEPFCLSYHFICWHAIYNNSMYRHVSLCTGCILKSLHSYGGPSS